MIIDNLVDALGMIFRVTLVDSKGISVEIFKSFVEILSRFLILGIALNALNLKCFQHFWLKKLI